MHKWLVLKAFEYLYGIFCAHLLTCHIFSFLRKSQIENVFLKMSVSILMPFRNTAPWIEETIDSVLIQSIEDWELIAIDDHSTDASSQLIEKYRHPKIKILKNEGSGIIPALQTGLKNATGTFITRMDADDVMPPKKLEQLRDLLLNSNPRTIATGHVKYFGENEISSGYLSYQNWINDRCSNEDHYDHIFRECVVASPNWMVRKNVIIDDQIFDHLKYPEDYDMTFRWMQKGFQIVSANAVTHLWREHPTRTSRNSEVYDQESFFELKLQWFLKLHPEISSLAVFGADRKGKLTVKHLEEDYQIHWYDIAFEQFKSPIMGYEIKDPRNCSEDFAVIAVYPKNLEMLEKFLEEKGFVIGKNAWYL